MNFISTTFGSKLFYRLQEPGNDPASSLDYQSAADAHCVGSTGQNQVSAPNGFVAGTKCAGAKSDCGREGHHQADPEALAAGADLYPKYAAGPGSVCCAGIGPVSSGPSRLRQVDHRHFLLRAGQQQG